MFRTAESVRIFYMEENSMGTIKLINPIMVDGEECKEFAYDISKLTVQQYIECTTRGGLASNKLMEINATLQFWLGAYAISNASNGKVDVMDIERVKGRDNITIARIGREMFSPEEGISIDNYKQKLKLLHGLENAGVQIKDLDFDVDSITNEQFINAYDKGGYATNKMMEVNDAFHLYLGIYAVINKNKDLSMDIIEAGIHGKDVIVLATVGRNFFTPPVEDTRAEVDI